jgi:hypothetical protein
LEVLSPKVNGLINLDRAVGNDEMDFLIIFSSVSGSLGTRVKQTTQQQMPLWTLLQHTGTDWLPQSFVTAVLYR